MKFIISFNGVDGCGKTTQLNLFHQENPHIVQIVGGLENYQPFASLPAGNDNFNWWFHESDPQEFLDVILSSMKARNEDIMSGNKPIVIIDKGNQNFYARIYATLRVKGVSHSDSLQLLQKNIHKYGLVDIEDVAVYFQISSSSEAQVKISIERSTSNLCEDDVRLYQQYQAFQNKALQWQLAQKKYVLLDSSGTISQIHALIQDLMYESMLNQLCFPVSGKKIFALGGLSECGKSGAGKYLSKKHNIWNLKFRFFLERLGREFGLENALDLYHDNSAFVALLEIDVISDFLSKHYYKRAISLESLHSYALATEFKKILQKQFVMIYIDTDLSLRIERNALSEFVSIADSQTSVMRKDMEKVSLGADKIREISDYVICNNRSMIDFYRELDLITTDTLDDTVETMSAYSLDIPDKYRQAIMKFQSSLVMTMGLRLKLLMVTGSCARGCVIPDFSDIDLIIALEQVNTCDRIAIQHLCDDCDIHIGFTIYSSKEIRSGLIDPKTAYALLQIKERTFFPLYIDKSLVLPHYEHDDVALMYRNMFPASLHETRRLLSGECEFHSLLKSLTHLMRNILFQNRCDCHGYLDVFQTFSDMYSLNHFDVLSSIKTMDVDALQKYANYIVDFVGSIYS